MRELTNKEVEEISGGFGLVGAGIGAAVSGVSAYGSGSSIGQIVGSSILGGVSGFFGGFAASRIVPTAGRFAFGAMSVQTGIISNAAGTES